MHTTVNSWYFSALISCHVIQINYKMNRTMCAHKNLLLLAFCMALNILEMLFSDVLYM